MSIVVTNTTRHLVPKVPFSKITKKVMGVSYALSIVFVTPAKIRVLNRTYRKKDSSTDILSFSVSKQIGELYFSMPDVKKKAPSFGLSAPAYLKYLYIHGLVHLKGFDHGKKMDTLERTYCRQFNFKHPSQTA